MVVGLAGKGSAVAGKSVRWRQAVNPEDMVARWAGQGSILVKSGRRDADGEAFSGMVV